MTTNEQLAAKRHTLAHLMAKAIVDHYPHAKLTLGPAIDTGFYYDVDFSGGPSLGDDGLKDIEKAMKKLLNTWTSWGHREVTLEEARAVFAGNQFKLELIEEIAARGEAITLYTCGTGKSEFADLCRGGHSENPQAEIAADSFRLDKVAGAYWRGDETKPMLTRIYGLAFETRTDLDAYLHQIEEAKKRDHRLIGEKMDLFHFDDAIGKGLPIWLPKGNIIKEALENWAKETEEKWGYDRVTTPIITKEDLFYTSGHLPLYKDSMYAPIVIEEENYYIKPMNCPFHHRAFAARPKSYRDLPVRLCEYGWCHRYEDSGSLFGLMRVRGMQMNDAHIYVSREQAVEEFVSVIKLHEYYYQALGITKYEMELALRDPKKMDKYHGDEEDWKEAERMTIEAMEKSGVPYTIAHEGAAFYGPKMDFQIESSIGRKFTASTNQLDLYMGKQFKLEYTDKDGLKKIPAIIHRAPLGTHERFIGFLIEHYGGNFPLWLAPEQVRIVPVNDVHNAYATEVYEILKSAGLRTHLDNNNESMGKKIRQAKTDRLPYFIVLGDHEVNSRTVTLEKRDGTKSVLTLDDLVAQLTHERDTKAL